VSHLERVDSEDLDRLIGKSHVRRVVSRSHSLGDGALDGRIGRLAPTGLVAVACAEGRNKSLICDSEKQKYFCDWTGNRELYPSFNDWNVGSERIALARS
jgi:hypothetical protein